MPPENMLWIVTGVVLAGVLFWVGRVLTTVKAPWQPAPGRAPHAPDLPGEDTKPSDEDPGTTPDEQPQALESVPRPPGEEDGEAKEEDEDEDAEKKEKPKPGKAEV